MIKMGGVNCQGDLDEVEYNGEDGWSTLSGGTGKDKDGVEYIVR